MNQPPPRKLRMALIGGAGQGFIGRVHATAATLDNRAELVAGALSSDPKKGKAAAGRFGIQPDRAYGSYIELLQQEAEREPGERVDFVSIATPNFTHFEIAKAALEAGFDVVCDKPMTIELAEARELASLVRQTGAVLAVTHSYSGYPMIRQARQLIQHGQLGQIQAVRAHYIQGWLRGLQPGQTPPRGAWKGDPALAGSGSLGDIGTHAWQLTRYLTELQPVELCCQLRSFAPQRTLDDYGVIMAHCHDDALVVITLSQVTHGRLNDLRIEVDGTEGSLAWHQEDPNHLVVRRFGKPVQTFERNPAAPYTSDSVRMACRLPGGHPEGFLEAFANVYRDAFDDMLRRAAGEPTETPTRYPNVDDGVEGVAFVEQCLASSQTREWVRI